MSYFWRKLSKSLILKKGGRDVSRVSSRWLVDDSWQNRNHRFFAERIPHTLKNGCEFQTWSNLWWFDISQVTWIKIFCVSKRPAHWSRKETPWVRSHRCSSHPCVPSPPGLEAIITNFASKQIQQCDRLVHAQSISQDLNKKMECQTPSSFSFGPQEGFDAIPYLFTKNGNCCSSISNENFNLEAR